MKRLAVVVGLVLGLSVLAGCADKARSDKGGGATPVVEGIETAEVEYSYVKDLYETAGTVRAVRRSSVSARVMGVVRTIHVKEGQRVRKGDVLVEISSPDIEAKARAAGKAVEEAEKVLDMAIEEKRLADATFERFRGLYDGKAVSGQEFDEVKARKELALLRYEQALKGLERAKAMSDEALSFLEYTFVRSPIDGTVAQKRIDVGSMATPGTPLLIVEGREYLVEVPVDESMTGRIREGVDVLLSIDSLGVKADGKVSTVVRQVDPVTRTFTVKIRPGGEIEGLRGGLFARAAFPMAERPRLLVPAGAVVKRGQLRGVYVVDGDGMVSLRFVSLGRVRGDKVEILSGLATGERIVVSGTERVVGGGLTAQRQGRPLGSAVTD
ncbi:MAG: efflux RND transporter periplasmic adaptor subunit [Nitrospirae bacterium]|nr:efflux RND transporter periplasmic adaptor subunit [Nitrospirota bacterium]